MCLEGRRKKHGVVCIMQLLQSAAAGLGTLQSSMSHSEAMVDRVKRGVQRDESRMHRQNGEDAFHNGQGVEKANKEWCETVRPISIPMESGDPA